MTLFDDEERVIEYIQEVKIWNIEFVNFSFGLFKFFLSFYTKQFNKRWKNNTESRPDFINSKDKYMMEVMRFDDYKPGYHSQLAYESRATEKYRNEFIKANHYKPEDKNILIFVNPIIGKEAENNIKHYYNNFTSVINKHRDKIEKYKTNYPNYKLGFLLLDESPGYVETKDKIDHKIKFGDKIGACRMYYSIYDKKFQDNLLSLDADYLVLETPYKDNRLKIGIIPIKELFLVDLKKARKTGIKRTEYDEQRIVCIEAPLEEPVDFIQN